MQYWLDGANERNLPLTNFSSSREAEKAKVLSVVYRNVSPFETDEAHLPSGEYNFPGVFLFALVRLAYCYLFTFFWWRRWWLLRFKRSV